MTTKIPKEFGVFIEGAKSPIATAPSRLLARRAMRQLPPPKEGAKYEIALWKPLQFDFFNNRGR